MSSKPQHAPEPCRHPLQQPRNPFKVLDKNQEPALWKQFLEGDAEDKVAEKPKERSEELLGHKKEQKPGSNCQAGTALSSGVLLKKPQPAAAGQKQAERKELPRVAKETESTHQRNLPEMKAKQHQRSELSRPSASQERPNCESQGSQRGSEAPRVKETEPLPRNVPRPDTAGQPRRGGSLGKEQPATPATAGVKDVGNTAVQSHQKGLSLAPSQPPSKCPGATSEGRAAPGPSPGEGRAAATSSEDSEGDDDPVSSSHPGRPLLLGSTLNSEKEQSLPLPAPGVHSKPPPASVVPKKVEPSDPAAQRRHLTTQLKQKKVRLRMCFVSEVRALSAVLRQEPLCKSSVSACEAFTGAPQPSASAFSCLCSHVGEPAESNKKKKS